MYYPQIKRFADKFSREQLLILNFENVLRDQPTYITKILYFYGLPANQSPPLTAMPDDNNEEFGGKVVAMDCKTRDDLGGVYNQFNNELYGFLKRTHFKAPPQEPAFGYFGTPDCSTVGELTADQVAGVKDAAEARSGAQPAHEAEPEVRLPAQPAHEAEPEVR